MKKILLLFFLCNILQKNYAQTKLLPGKLKGKYHSYIVSKIPKNIGDTGKFIGIENKVNKYPTGIPYSVEEKKRTFLPMDPKKDIHVDNNIIKQVVLSVLNYKLEALKKNKETLSIIFVFEPSGKLTDIGFFPKEKTIISLEDIENIDTKLRQTVKVTFTGTQYKYYIGINCYPPDIVF